LLSAHTPDIGGVWMRVSSFALGDAEVNTNELRRLGIGLARYVSLQQTLLPNIDISLTWVAGSSVEISMGHEIQEGLGFTGYIARYDLDRYQIFVSPTVGASILLAELVEAAPSLPTSFLLQFRQFGTPRLILTVGGIQKLSSNDRRVEQCFTVGLGLPTSTSRIDNFLAIESPTFSVQYDSQLIRAPDRVISY